MNFFKPLLYFSFVVLVHSSLINRKRTARLIRGNATVPGDFKYMVAIMRNGVKVTCGGGIIDERTILSAAHCFIDHTNDFKKDNFSILAGTIDINNLHDPRRVVAEIEKIVVPRAYKDETTNDDIAVIKLKTPLNVSKNDLQILHLATPTDIGNFEKLAVVTGFGWQELKEVDDKYVGRLDGKLYSADVRIITEEECVKNFREENVLCGFMIVKGAYKPEPYGMCKGDSGSPLVIEPNTIVGVLAFGDHRCNENYNLPTYYASVTAYSNFINEAMEALQSNVGSGNSKVIRMS